MRNLILVMLLVVMSILSWAGNQQQVTVTGTTTSAYVTVYTLPYNDKIQAGVTLKNTGTSSNHIQFIVTGYLHPDAVEGHVLATSDELADDKTAIVNINDTYYQVVVQVMYPAGGAASTYSCTYRVSR